MKAEAQRSARCWGGVNGGRNADLEFVNLEHNRDHVLDVHDDAPRGAGGRSSARQSST
jgi:hypothetical protein